jgi:hypothetical protein
LQFYRQFLREKTIHGSPGALLRLRVDDVTMVCVTNGAILYVRVCVSPCARADVPPYVNLCVQDHVLICVQVYAHPCVIHDAQVCVILGVQTCVRLAYVPIYVQLEHVHRGVQLVSPLPELDVSLRVSLQGLRHEEHELQGQQLLFSSQMAS